MQDLGEKIRHNASWLIGSNMITRVLKFGVSIVLARLLLPEEFGLIVTMSVFTGIAGYFAAGGMGDALVRATELKETDYAVVFTAQLLICALIFSIFYFIAPTFARWLDEPLYEPLLRVSALTFVLRPFLNVPSSRLSREMRFRDLSLIRFVTFSASSTTSVYLAWLGYGPWALLLGGLAGAIITFPLMSWAAGWWPRIHYDLESLRNLGSMGVKFSANHIVGYLLQQSGNLIVSKLMGPGAVGIFNRAESLASAPRGLVIKASYESLFRGFAEIQDNLSQSRYLYLRSITLFSVYTMPLYVGLWWLADPLIPFVYGPAWSPAVEPIRIIAGTALLLVGNPAGALIAAQGKLMRQLYVKIEVLAVLITTCIIGAKYDITGVAFAVTGTRLYSSFRQHQLAASCVNADLRDLAHALAVPYLLNGVLFTGLWGISYMTTVTFQRTEPIVYLCAMAVSGTLLYGAMFFFLPFKSLRSEADRWKGMLRLPLSSGA